MKRTKVEESFLAQEKIRLMFSAQPKCKYVQKYLREGVVADIGCSVGIEIAFIQHMSNFVVGIDIDSDLLKIAKNHLPRENGANLLAGDACNLPFKERAFDVIVMFDVIEHLNDPLKVLTHLSTILKDEGILILGVPNEYTFGEALQRFLHFLDESRGIKLLWNVHHVNFFDVAGLKDMGDKTGFCIREALVMGNPYSLNCILSIVISLISKLVFFNNPLKYKWINSITSKNEQTRNHFIRIRQFDKKLPRFFFYNYMILIMSKKR